MSKLERSLAVALAAANLALTSGCIIYRTADPPPEPEGYEVVEQPPPAPQRIVVQNEPRYEGPPPAAAPMPPPTPPEALVAPSDPQQAHKPRHGVAGQTNAPRITAPNLFGNGAGGNFRGLVFLMPDDVEHLPDFSRLQPVATLFTDRFDVKPQEFRGGFPGASNEEEWFAIRFDGPIFLNEGGVWRFRLVSDDGAALYVDGRKVLDNDGVHGPRTVRGALELPPGRHHLRLDYFQGNKGPVALQLFVAPPSSPNSEAILTGMPR